MTEREELVRRLRSQIGDDVREIYSHEALFKLAAARIEADGKLIGEMRAFVAEIAAWQVLEVDDVVCRARALLARLEGGE